MFFATRYMYKLISSKRKLTNTNNFVTPFWIFDLKRNISNPPPESSTLNETSCKDCRSFIMHVENNKQYPDLGKCKKNGYFLPKSGEQYYFYANSCRSSDLYCGPTAKYFTKK